MSCGSHKIPRPLGFEIFPSHWEGGHQDGPRAGMGAFVEGGYGGLVEGDREETEASLLAVAVGAWDDAWKWQSVDHDEDDHSHHALAYEDPPM